MSLLLTQLMWYLRSNYCALVSILSEWPCHTLREVAGVKRWWAQRRCELNTHIWRARSQSLEAREIQDGEIKWKQEQYRESREDRMPRNDSNRRMEKRKTSRLEMWKKWQKWHATCGPTLGRVREDSVTTALDDRGFGRVLLAVAGGLWGMLGPVSSVGFGRVLAALSRVRTPVMLTLALLLQRQPAWDVVQLCRVGQVD